MRSSVDTGSVSPRLDGPSRPVAARDSGLRLPLLLLSAVVLWLPHRHSRQLRRSLPGHIGAAVPSLGRAAAGECRGGIAGLRLGVSLRVRAGFIGQISPVKVRLPSWVGYFRYVVLVGLVLLLPLLLGLRGIPFEEQAISICRLCPAGALEAGMPYSVRSLVAGQGWLMSGVKSGILLTFVLAALVVHRPWCRLFCPLGALLGLFNRWSLFHLLYNPQACTECSLCRSRCAMGVYVDEKVNVSGCIRCLECTTCGALEPRFAWPARAEPISKAPRQVVGLNGWPLSGNQRDTFWRTFR